MITVNHGILPLVYHFHQLKIPLCNKVSVRMVNWPRKEESSIFQLNLRSNDIVKVKQRQTFIFPRFEKDS